MIAHDHYEMRRGREVLCRGTVVNLGYSKERLAQMYKAGYRLFKNGKVVKLCQL